MEEKVKINMVALCHLASRLVLILCDSLSVSQWWLRARSEGLRDRS